MNSEIEEWVQSQLDIKEQAYASGNLGALQDALMLCRRDNYPLPEWAAKAMGKLIVDDLVGRKKKTGRSRQARWIRKYHDDISDLIRAETVQECIEHNIPKVDAYAAASLILEGGAGEGSEDTIRKAVTRYNRRMKTDPYRYHLLSTVPLPKETRRNIPDSVFSMQKKQLSH